MVLPIEHLGARLVERLAGHSAVPVRSSGATEERWPTGMGACSWPRLDARPRGRSAELRERRQKVAGSRRIALL
jgi:hypothetical protein